MSPPPNKPPEQSSGRWTWWLVTGCATVILLGILLTALRQRMTLSANQSSAPLSANANERTAAGTSHLRQRRENDGPALSVQEMVAQKVVRFVQGRRETLAKLAKHLNLEVPTEFDQFFHVAEIGSWEDIQKLFKTMNDRRQREAGSEAMASLWPVVTETFGVLEQTHKWPAQQLLDYGQAVLGSLRPDMVYLGGTDAGRFIPTLLNDTSDGDRHIVLTQNAFADTSYLAYARFLYADQLNPLTGEDSQQAFQAYLAEAQRRLQHDQQSPDEAPQLRRGENIQVTDNRVQVSGQVAVMAINERLLNALIKKNPDVSFAMEESFSLPSTYVNATPLGPILELRAADAQTALTSDLAAQSLDYFRATARTLAVDPETSANADLRTAYAQQATAQANLFASRNLPAEAEQGYRLATELSPTTLGPVNQLAELLARNGRMTEANQLLDHFAAQNPSQQQQVQAERDYLATLRRH